VLTAASGGPSSNSNLQVMFNITNPASNQESPVVRVSAEIAVNVGTIAVAAMTKTTASLYGVPNGTDPLTIVEPLFSTKAIRQSTPVSGAVNTITVTLVSSTHDSPAGTVVTLSGLTGSQTASSGSLLLTSTSGLLGTAGSWTQGTGTLELTVEAGGLTKGSTYVVTFNLTNTASDQASPAISIEATIKASGIELGHLAQVSMSKPGSSRFGVANGTDPLLVLVPVFASLWLGETLNVKYFAGLGLILAGLFTLWS